MAGLPNGAKFVSPSEFSTSAVEAEDEEELLVLLHRVEDVEFLREVPRCCMMEEMLLGELSIKQRLLATRLRQTSCTPPVRLIQSKTSLKHHNIFYVFSHYL